MHTHAYTHVCEQMWTSARQTMAGATMPANALTRRVAAHVATAQMGGPMMETQAAQVRAEWFIYFCCVLVRFGTDMQ